MPRAGYKGKGNVIEFQQELKREVEALVKKGFPGGVKALALELRQACEEGAPKDTGTLAGSFTVGVGVVNSEQPGGEASAVAALGRYENGDDVLVFASGRGEKSPYYGWFIEHGWVDKAGKPHAGSHFVRAALEKVAHKAVRV